MNRSLVIDLVGDFGVVLAQRIVGELREVHHRIHALEVLRFGVAQIEHARERDDRHPLRIDVQRTLAIEPRVEPPHFVARRNEQRRQPGAYVAFSSGDENLHVLVC